MRKLVLIVLSWSFLTSTAPSAWAQNIAPAAAGVKQLIAHRGASSERPECTLPAITRAIEVGATAVEVDVRTSKDGVLFVLHDASLDRTTDGQGRAGDYTIAELEKLDAGNWFDRRYAGTRIPTLAEALKACRQEADILLDLKETGEVYARAVAREVTRYGNPKRTIVGVRSVAQARLFRKLLPPARQLGLIPDTKSIEAFAQAGVEMIRLWPKWLQADGESLVKRVRAAKVSLHLNGTLGVEAEVRALLEHQPQSLSSDDPGQLRQTLAKLAGFGPLPGTQALTWKEADLSRRMMDGAHRFVERKIRDALTRRPVIELVDQKKRQAQRDELARIIGATDKRLPPRMERFGDDMNPALVAETDLFTVYQVRWPVVEGLFGEGLLVEPKRPTIAGVVVIPDADQTPEQLMGLSAGVPSENQFARRLADSGLRVVIPTLISRERLSTRDSRLLRSDQTRREWIYRQAFQMGRHPIGLEVQQVRAAIDWLMNRQPRPKVGVAGYGEGGLIALYTAALDYRVWSTFVSGYFDNRQNVWREPIYRNIWGLLKHFGDAELAGLCRTNSIIVEYSRVPRVENQKGALSTPKLLTVQKEIERAPRFYRPRLIAAPGGRPIGPGHAHALAPFTANLSVQFVTTNPKPLKDRREDFAAARQQRLLKQAENYIQNLVRASEHVRDQRFLFRVMPELTKARWSTLKKHATHPPEKFIAGAKAFRREFQLEAMGRFDEPLLPFNARTRKIIEHEKWTAYDVVLDVFPELFSWGVLIVPKGIQPGERRPVVVCQHGRNGLPRSTIDQESTAYNHFAARLAERGFITFAPHNLYRGEDRYRWLDRKANSIKASLFSFIIAQHDQTLKWLKTLPFVDGKRIAFYGLSYGGETAVRVPTILPDYCLSICSGDFNQWTRKVAATDQPFSFMRTIEWEMPYWNLGQTFDYAEMAYLMVPRPFMVERGHLDLVGRDRWVAHEYAKVRWLYAQLGLADRTAITFFQGGHSIKGEKTFEFLHKHLKWPRP